MKAADIMSSKVISVPPHMSGRAVAKVLFKNGISAVPVVDEHGAPIGMVSEGDLMPRDESEREARRDWWLQALSEGEEINPELANYVAGTERTASQIMIKPVLTVSEDADVVEIADLLSRNRIKRVPVVRDGRMVGIVSRADLVRAFAQPQGPQRLPDRSNEPAVASEKLEALARSHKPSRPAPQPDAPAAVSAPGFQGLVAHFHKAEVEKRKKSKELAEEQHHKDVNKLLGQHLSEETWKRMLANAQIAASQGHEDSELLRFPGELCSDRGRAINVSEHDWPATLHGLAADVYLRWNSELRPKGFGIYARVINYRDGMPGDFGLYLSWGKKDAAKG